MLSELMFEGQSVRIVEFSDEDPHWVARDVGEILGIDQSTLVRRLANMPDNWKGMYSIHTPGGSQTMATVTEAGLYELIFRSDKPEARKFQVWVFEVVLPQIRKTGSYQVSPQPKPLPVATPALQAVGSLKFMGRDILGAAQLVSAMLKAEEHVQPRGMQHSLLRILNDHLEFIGFHHAKALEAAHKAADPNYDVMKDLDPDGRSYSFLEWMAQKVK
jgi:prophage antirepressor-like protein